MKDAQPHLGQAAIRARGTRHACLRVGWGRVYALLDRSAGGAPTLGSPTLSPIVVAFRRSNRAGATVAEQDPPDEIQVTHPSEWGLCEPFMIQLPITGAVISIVDRSGHRATIASTDPVASRWDELELELGTGPLTDATAQSAPQLVGDVRTSAMNPVVGSQLARLGVRALFAFPLTMGLATVGVVGLYRNDVGALQSDAVGVALGLARWATIPAVRAAVHEASRDGGPDSSTMVPGIRREVHQATGMLSAQLDITTSEAFARLRAYAISSERSITAMAQDIISGAIDFLDLD